MSTASSKGEQGAQTCPDTANPFLNPLAKPEALPEGFVNPFRSILQSKPGQRPVDLPRKTPFETGSIVIHINTTSEEDEAEVEKFRSQHLGDLAHQCEQCAVTLTLVETCSTDDLLDRLHQLERSDMFISLCSQPDTTSPKSTEAAAEYPWVEGFSSALDVLCSAALATASPESAPLLLFKAGDPLMSALSSKHGGSCKELGGGSCKELGSGSCKELGGGSGAKQIHEHIVQILQPVLGKKKTSRIDSENKAHLAAVKGRVSTFVGRDLYLKALDESLALTPSVPLALLGEYGVGKSTILSAWITRTQQTSVPVVYHVVGCTPRSHNVVDMLQRLVRSLAKLLPQQQSEKSDKSDKASDLYDVRYLDVTELAFLFSILVEAVSKVHDKVVIVIDGLDELLNFRQWEWLPRTYPPNVHVVVSATDATQVQAMRWRAIEVKRLSPEDLLLLVENNAGVKAAVLSEKQKFKIMSTQACGNALFLRTLVQELAKMPNAKDADLAPFLQAKTTEDLLHIILNRADSEEAARVFPVIAASRQGLTQPELFALASITPLQWLRVIRRTDHLLEERSGHVVLGNLHLVGAVRHHYVLTKERRADIRTRLAEYFQEKVTEKHLSERTVSELPWLYQQTGCTDLLRLCVSEPRVSLALSLELAHGNEDVLRYWRSIDDSPEDIATSYLSNLDKHIKVVKDDRSKLQDVAVAALRVGEFFTHGGNQKQAVQPFSKALALTEAINGKDSHRLATVSVSLARLCMMQNDMKSAEKFFTRASKSLRDHYGDDDPRVAKTEVGLSVIYKKEERFDEALNTLQRCERIYQGRFRPDHPEIATVLHLKGEVFMAQAQHDAAVTALTQALRIREAALGEHHLATAMTQNVLGKAFLQTGKISEAEVLIHKALNTRKTILQAHADVAESYTNLALVNAVKGTPKESLALYAQAVEMLEKANGVQSFSLCEPLDRMAEIAVESGDKAAAIAHTLRSLSIKEKKHGEASPALADACYTVAQLFADTNDIDAALTYITRAHDIASVAYGPDHPLSQEAKEKMDNLKALKGLRKR